MAKAKSFRRILAVALVFGLVLAGCATTETAITQESSDMIVGTWSVSNQKFTFNPDYTGTQEMMGAIIDFTYSWDKTHSLYLIKNASTQMYFQIVSPQKAYGHGSYTFKPAMAKLTFKKKS
jgi:hypothetical protein